MGLLLFIPLIIYQNLVLPTFILPSAQAMGLWGHAVIEESFTWRDRSGSVWDERLSSRAR